MWLNQDNDNDGDIDYAVDDYEEYDSDQYDSVNGHCNLIHSDRKVTSYRSVQVFYNTQWMGGIQNYVFLNISLVFFVFLKLRKQNQSMFTGKN